MHRAALLERRGVLLSQRRRPLAAALGLALVTAGGLLLGRQGAGFVRAQARPAAHAGGSGATPQSGRRPGASGQHTAHPADPPLVEVSDWALPLQAVLLASAPQAAWAGAESAYLSSLLGWAPVAGILVFAGAAAYATFGMETNEDYDPRYAADAQDRARAREKMFMSQLDITKEEFQQLRTAVNEAGGNLGAAAMQDMRAQREQARSQMATEKQWNETLEERFQDLLSQGAKNVDEMPEGAGIILMEVAGWEVVRDATGVFYTNPSTGEVSDRLPPTLAGKVGVQLDAPPEAPEPTPAAPPAAGTPRPGDAAPQAAGGGIPRPGD